MVSKVVYTLFALTLIGGVVRADDGITESYDKINEILKYRLGWYHSADEAIKVLEDLRGQLVNNTVNEDLLSAVEQLLSLKLAVNEERCSLKSYKILKTNYDAVQTRTQVGAQVEFVKGLVGDFHAAHKQVCDIVYPNKFKLAVEKLDNTTLRASHVLASEFLFQNQERYEFSRVIEHCRYPIVSHSFQSYESVALLNMSVSALPTNGTHLRWKREYALYDYLVYRVLKITMTKKHPDYEYLFGDADGNINKEKVLELHKKFLVEPCEKYLESVKRVMVPASYDYSYNTEKFELSKVQYSQRFGYLVGQSAWKLCNLVRNSIEIRERQLIDLLESGKYKDLDKDMEYCSS